MNAEALLSKLFLDNNLQTLMILLDRAAWFWKAHDILTRNSMAVLREQEPGIEVGKAARPLGVACAYAETVFLASAIEAFFLMTYTNSVVIYFHWKRQLPTSLREGLDAKTDGKFYKSMSGMDKLRSLSMTNLNQAEKRFEEIYGATFFSSVCNELDHKNFRAACEILFSQRNGILHRGGETKKGKFIAPDFKELNDLRAQSLKFCRRLAETTVEWWVSQLSHDPAVGKAILAAAQSGLE